MSSEIQIFVKCAYFRFTQYIPNQMINIIIHTREKIENILAREDFLGGRECEWEETSVLFPILSPVVQCPIFPRRRGKFCGFGPIAPDFLILSLDFSILSTKVAKKIIIYRPFFSDFTSAFFIYLTFQV